MKTQVERQISFPWALSKAERQAQFIAELDEAMRSAGLKPEDVFKASWPEDPMDKWLRREGRWEDAEKAMEEMGARRNDRGRWIKRRRAE